MENKRQFVGGCCSVSRLSAITHLAVQWLLYNIALIITLYITCDAFDHNERDTLVAMALISFGLVAMQYDLWTLKRTSKKIKEVVPDG